MADRKISELPLAQKVFDGDLMVAVTGYGQRTNPLDPESPYVSFVTTKVPVSGFVAHSFRVNEVVGGGTGIMVSPNINNSNPATATPNTVNLHVTGVAFKNHTHSVADVLNFASGVSGQIQQIIKFQSVDLPCTGNLTVTSSDLQIPLAANSKYLCELGTVFVNNEVSSVISGLIKVTGAMDVNYPTRMYGTWNHLFLENHGYNSVYNSSSAVSDYGVVVGSLDSSLVDQPVTVVNKFTVETTSNEADTLSFAFTTNSNSPSTSGVLKKGSWFKAEKII